MGIDPNDPTRGIGAPVVIPTDDPAPAPSPVPRGDDGQPSVISNPTTATVASGETSVPATVADNGVNVFLVSGYFEALRREYAAVASGAKDHARAILAEMRLIDEDGFKAFVASEPSAQEIVGNVDGTPPPAK